MAVLDITSAARADFEVIGQDSVDRFGFDAAEAYLSRLTAALGRLQDFPESAPQLPKRDNGVRKLTVGSHVAFYRVEGDIVRILRILHQRMDPARHL
jgi:toxin ParE1/3/4